MNQNYLLIFDFETVNLACDLTSPCELAAKVLDPKTLEFLPDQFHSMMKPPDLSKVEQGALQVTGIKMEDLEKAPDQKIVWESFVNFCKKYTKGKSVFDAPVRCGFNILKFDDLIINALCQKYGNLYKGQQGIFHPRDVIDLMHVCFLWFESSNEVTKFNMDHLRDYFGLPHTGHRGLVDVEHEGLLISKFLKLKRSLLPKIKFKGSLSGS